LPLINSEIRAQVRDALADLVERMKFIVFTQRGGGALFAPVYYRAINTHGLGFAPDGRTLVAINVTTTSAVVINTADNSVRDTFRIPAATVATNGNGVGKALAFVKFLGRLHRWSSPLRSPFHRPLLRTSRQPGSPSRPSPVTALKVTPADGWFAEAAGGTGS
jgi:hypothetical protein